MFAGMQSLQYKEAPNTVEELVQSVKNAYSDYKPELLKDNLMTLHKCMESSMKVCGGNNYKLPHLKKKMKKKAGNPIKKVLCEESVLNLALNKLKKTEI